MNLKGALMVVLKSHNVDMVALQTQNALGHPKPSHSNLF